MLPENESEEMSMKRKATSTGKAEGKNQGWSEKTGKQKTDGQARGKTESELEKNAGSSQNNVQDDTGEFKYREEWLSSHSGGCKAGRMLI